MLMTALSYFPFNEGITVLIGDRGSGKSTVLNLLGLLAVPSDTSTGVLVTKLMQLLRNEPDRNLDRARRVQSILQHYGVEQYACFYYEDHELTCYIVDVTSGEFAVLKLHDGLFEFDISEHHDNLDMQFLQQGEVFRIADASNRFYLNSLLDALFPELEVQRQKLITAVEQHRRVMDHSGLNRGNHRNRWFLEFAVQRHGELNALANAASHRHLDATARKVLEDYHAQSCAIDLGEPPFNLWESLTDKRSFWRLYLSRASRHIQREVPALLQLPTLSDDVLTSQLAALWRSDDEVSSWEGDDSQDDSTIDTIEPVFEGESTSNEPWEILGAIASGLRARLKRLVRTRWRFASRFIWDIRLKAIAKSYASIHASYIALVALQERVCEQVTALVNRDGTSVRVFTLDHQASIERAREEIRRMEAIGATNEVLMVTSWRDSEATIDGNLTSYINLTARLLSESKRLTYDEEVQDLLHCPVEIELRQGSEYRSFVQLSFGQKSGIILKMMLSATTKHSIIIDQPEDNLDTNAIVHMLGPALRTLGKDRQVIIATHSANLIMGLADAKLVVLKSSGAYGCVLTQGSLLTQSLTRAVLDILEGGAAAFETKIKMYEQFVQQLSGQIRDMDINAIESTFRRRTIDGLRNFLQPMVSDRAMLEFFRHELRQPSRIGSHIKEARQALGRGTEEPAGATVASRLDRLLETLDGHVTQLQAKIEEMRMLDTQPRKSAIRLGPLVRDLADEYAGRFGQSFRRISIGVEDTLDSKEIFADPSHIKLVFANLFKNSLRATELQAVARLSPGAPPFPEKLEVKLGDAQNGILRLLLHDNGRGIPTAIEPKLYQERCSDQVGEGHGLGGVIIRKILDLNGGSVRVVASSANVGTLQEITFINTAEPA